ncbi:hypothetical protein [Synechococcus sp. CBW1107]|uniref:hypothetical protein n=1 Tax=Synechococcus sp. CBW1107 TaxID=2789857 RepID=UPI002AD3FC0D|nr:hypothetical protein [Synechococcus sp. CBW1107]
MTALRSRIEPRQLLRSSPDQAPFQGTGGRDGFRITRVIPYRKAFLPRVRGRFRGGPGGTRVDIRLSPHPVVMVLLSIWCGGLALAVVASLGANQLPLVAIPLGMLVAGWASMCAAGFWTEATKQKLMLMLIAMVQELEQEPAPNAPRATEAR